MAKGVVKMKYKGEIVQEKQYASSGGKKNILDLWKKLYGKGYERSEIIDEPKEHKMKSVKKQFTGNGAISSVRIHKSPHKTDF